MKFTIDVQQSSRCPKVGPCFAEIMSLFNSKSLVTALLLAQSLALPGPNSPRSALQERDAGKLAAENPRAAFFRNVLHNSDYCNFTKVATPQDVPMKVGIIGAGAAGLYAAMLLDSLDIDYDIHEASDRIGGRIFTYRFDQATWDNSTPSDPEYYDYYVSIGRCEGLLWPAR